MIWILICVGFSLFVIGHIMNDNDWAFIPGLSGLCLLLGIMFYVMITIAHAECGGVSYYTTHETGGHKTASGQRLNNSEFTAAHRSYPFGTRLTVQNQKNGKTISVTVNDRGPYSHGRILDVTIAGARALGIDGIGKVCIWKN